MNAMVPPQPVVRDGLIWGADDLVMPWIADRIEGMEGLTFGDSRFPATSIGVLGRDRVSGQPCIMGGVAYSFWSKHPEGGDCQVSIAMAPGVRVTRRMWRHFYAHPFVTMGCRRITAQVLKKNRRSRDHVKRAGFRIEGCRPEAQGRQAMMMYGMLRAECRFLRERP